jgi:LysR family transcriptional regulator for metE and metH
VTLRLEIKQLQMLTSIVAKDGLTAAAHALGLTPSALSHRLREAERRLGFALFERHGHHLRLTPAGERLHQGALQVLDILAQAEQEAANIASGFTFSLKIGSRAYSCYLDGTIAGPLDALRDRSIDVLILSGPQTTPGLSVYPLFEDQLVGILPPDHAAIHKPWLEAEDFAGELYVTYSTAPEPGHEYEQLFRRAHVMPRRMLKAGLTEAIIELVHHAYGLSILAHWAVHPYLAQGYVIAKPLTQAGITVNWVAAVRADEPADSPARQFAEALALWCRQERNLIGYTGPVST